MAWPERRGAGKGAPVFGAAKPTLACEHCSDDRPPLIVHRENPVNRIAANAGFIKGPRPVRSWLSSKVLAEAFALMAETVSPICFLGCQRSRTSPPRRRSEQ